MCDGVRSEGRGCAGGCARETCEQASGRLCVASTVATWCVFSILPGMRSPSVVPLAEKGWFSLHSVISENDFWEIIESLRLAGAEGILVLPIEKMIL